MTAAIFVTYHPDPVRLQCSISSIIEQVDQVIVVSNSPMGGESWVAERFPQVSLVMLGSNHGIAEAQNKGLRLAEIAGHDVVVLSDQDTIYPEDYVASMCSVLASRVDFPIAAVVPAFHDEVKGCVGGYIPERSVFFGGAKLRGGVAPVHEAIASGMVISMPALIDVGLMDERLFIDWVDMEWCWRARASGYQVLMNADVVIFHKLGDRTMNIGYRSVNLRSPLRHYYITRNAFHLALRDQSLSSVERIVLFFRSMRYIFAFPILSRPRLANLRMVILAVFDAFAQRLGAFSHS